MKPDFALSLSFEGIVLLRRAAHGWVSLGEVALDETGLDEKLAALRARAETLAPDGRAVVKLVLPNDQIRYLDFEALSESDAAARDQAMAALDGATPYALSDLSVDVQLRQDRVYVAAVARETLAEAEGFARAHGFVPASSVAVPPDGGFEGEVFFGASESWRQSGEEPPERDEHAVRIVSEAENRDAPLADPVAAPVAEGNPPAGEDATEAEPEAGLALDAESETDAGSEADVAEVGEDAVDEEPVEADPEDLSAAPIDEPTAEAEPEPQPQPAPPKVAFTSIRAVRGLGPVPQPEGDALDAARKLSAGDRKDKPKARFTLAGVAARLPKDPGKAGVTAPTVPSATPDAGPERETVSKPAPSKVPEPPVVGKKPAGRLRAAVRLGAPVAAQVSDPKTSPEPAPKPSRPAPSAPATAVAEAVATDDSDERRRMTVFGARDAQVGGKPRHLGLALTAALILVLAGVAAWASVFLDEGVAGLFDRKAPAPRIAEAPAALVEELEAEPDPEMAAAATGDAAPAVELAALDLGGGEPDTVPSGSDTLSQPFPPRAAMSEAEAIEAYDASGIWQRSPLAPATILPDDTSAVYEASIDRSVEVQDAVALPSLAALSPDPVLDTPFDPLPADVEYELDDRGLVVARLEGAINPDGVMIYSGKPPVVSPVRPDFAAQGVTTPEEAAAFVRLQGFRPRARPEGLIESNERATLAGFSREELSALRPVARPVTQKEAVEEEDTTATAQAVARSLIPAARPRDIAAIVERTREAQATAARQAAPAEVQTASAAAVAAPRTIKPSSPSPGGVARQATIENAINLRRVNLIGVFGKPSQRRALVRLANGRYTKVQVGDRLDGGKVSSISDSELSYRKGGRNIVLSMPRG